MRHTARCIFFLFLFLWCNTLSAQYDIDSLKQVLRNPKLHDTTRLMNISLLIDNLSNNKEVNAYTNLMGAIAQLNLAKKSNDPVLQKKYTMFLAAYYNNISVRLEDKDDPRSLDYLNKSLALYGSVKAEDEVYSSMVSKGLLLSRRKRYKEAINCYYTALKYFEKNWVENVDGISYVYSNLGVLYGDQEQWDVAIKFLKKAAARLDQKKEKLTVEDELQKCTMFYNIGSAYLTLNDYPQGTVYLNKALILSKKYGKNSFSSYSMAKLALVDLHYKRLDAAEKKLLAADSLSDTELSKGFASVNLGDVYFQKHDYTKALHFLKEGMSCAVKTKNNNLKEIAYELLYKINKTKGNYKEAVTQLELFKAIKDSNKVEETKNELKRQQLQYDYEKKVFSYQLATQKKNAAKNNLLIGLVASLLLLLIGAYFLYRNYRQKQAISTFEKKELKQKLLLTQMNPHFIFNSIDNIQSLIYNKQDKEAVNYLTKFSKLTRQILENSNESYITLNEELSMIDNYMVIQQLLYNNKFDFNIDVDEKLDTEAVLLPPMLTQPFIENAIKHGLKNTTEKGIINIRFKFNNNKLFFEITDNGVGFTIDKAVNKKSLAMKITKERLINISKKSDFEVQIENRFDDKKNIIGAKVFFEIPYIYEK